VLAEVSVKLNAPCLAQVEEGPAAAAAAVGSCSIKTAHVFITTLCKGSKGSQQSRAAGHSTHVPHVAAVADVTVSKKAT
jgi:hypothetical protein